MISTKGYWKVDIFIIIYNKNLNNKKKKVRFHATCKKS